MATGNTARVFGLNRGIIAPGKEADLVFLDASLGSVGEDLLSCLAAGDNPGYFDRYGGRTGPVQDQPKYAAAQKGRQSFGLSANASAER